jgi:hypothetical protein
MTRDNFVRLYRFLGGALIASAVIQSLNWHWDDAGFSVANYFSYFTILSNLIAATVLLVGATRVGDPGSERWEMVRGAALLYMGVTGIVYAVALQSYDDVQTSVYANNVLHRVMPLVMLLDWLFEPPRVPLRFDRNLAWLIFPLLYLPYTLIRGPIVDWYPYPFVDPTRDGGYWRVAGSCLVVAALFVALTWLITWVGNTMRERKVRPVGMTLA